MDLAACNAKALTDAEKRDTIDLLTSKRNDLSFSRWQMCLIFHVSPNQVDDLMGAIAVSIYCANSGFDRPLRDSKLYHLKTTRDPLFTSITQRKIVPKLIAGFQCLRNVPESCGTWQHGLLKHHVNRIGSKMIRVAAGIDNNATCRSDTLHNFTRMNAKCGTVSPNLSPRRIMLANKRQMLAYDAKHKPFLTDDFRGTLVFKNSSVHYRQLEFRDLCIKIRLPKANMLRMENSVWHFYDMIISISMSYLIGIAEDELNAVSPLEMKALGAYNIEQVRGAIKDERDLPDLEKPYWFAYCALIVLIARQLELDHGGRVVALFFCVPRNYLGKRDVPSYVKAPAHFMHVLRMLRQHQLVTEADPNILMEFRDRNDEGLVPPDLPTNIFRRPPSVSVTRASHRRRNLQGRRNGNVRMTSTIRLQSVDDERVVSFFCLFGGEFLALKSEACRAELAMLVWCRGDLTSWYVRACPVFASRLLRDVFLQAVWCSRFCVRRHVHANTHRQLCQLCHCVVVSLREDCKRKRKYHGDEFRHKEQVGQRSNISIDINTILTQLRNSTEPVASPINQKKPLTTH